METLITVNEDVAETILQLIEDNDGYCPCSIERTPETKCQCKDFWEMTEGTCHCGLYTKRLQ